MQIKSVIMEIEEVSSCEAALPLLSLNHVSMLCRSVWASLRFYEEVLGFVLVKRPSSFDFNGAWLYNYGIGIHLIENPSADEFDSPPGHRPINPKDNHISFQCTDIGTVKRRLEEMVIRHETAEVEEEGIKVEQVFFHDPDGYMIEICNCDNIPIIPIISSSCPCKPRFPIGSLNRRRSTTLDACGFMETLMLETLCLDMMNISF